MVEYLTGTGRVVSVSPRGLVGMAGRSSLPVTCGVILCLCMANASGSRLRPMMEWCFGGGSNPTSMVFARCIPVGETCRCCGRVGRGGVGESGLPGLLGGLLKGDVSTLMVFLGSRMGILL